MIKRNAVINNKAFDHSIYYSRDIARWQLEDFLNNENVILINNDYLVIFKDAEHRNAPAFKVSELRRKSKADLYEMRRELMGVFSDDTKDTIIGDLLRITNENYYRAHYLITRWRDLERTTVIYGYSNSDVIAVNDLSGKIDKCELVHIFFDQPICGIVIETDILTGKSVDYQIDEYLDNPYEYDKEKLIVAMAGGDVDLAAYLNEFLPNDGSGVDYV